MSMLFPERWRINPPNSPMGHAEPGSPFGTFLIPPQPLTKTINSRTLLVIATDGYDKKDLLECGLGEKAVAEMSDAGDWEHVSVSIARQPDKLPSWDEMCLVKNTFWDKEDCVVQYHPPHEVYVDNNQVLHLWRWRAGVMPMPPSLCV